MKLKEKQKSCSEYKTLLYECQLTQLKPEHQYQKDLIVTRNLLTVGLGLWAIQSRAVK
jgi:hypothetical protein